ncbi:MAG: hypothetical protein AB7S71_03410 [Dongiaceae bacterium]
MSQPASESNTRNMKGLLALVIIMGVLIVAGLIVVVVTIAMRLSGSGTEATAARPGFETLDLPVPAGCQVMEMVAADDRLILRLGSGERCNQIIVVDAVNGQNLGTVRLMPQ